MGSLQSLDWLAEFTYKKHAQMFSRGWIISVRLLTVASIIFSYFNPLPQDIQEEQFYIKEFIFWMEFMGWQNEKYNSSKEISLLIFPIQKVWFSTLLQTPLNV